MKKLLIIGGGGHGSVVSACVKDNKLHDERYDIEVVGYINDFETEIDGYPVLGTLKDIPRLAKQGYYFIWAIHLIGNNIKTKQVYDQTSIPADRLLSVIHYSAFIAENVEIGAGCLIMSHAYIGARSRIGNSTMIKANTSIGHDVHCGALCHFAMGSVTGSYTHVGICSDIATGAVVMDKIHIGDCAMLGSGSLAMHDIPSGEIHVGSPARFLKTFLEV